MRTWLWVAPGTAQVSSSLLGACKRQQLANRIPQVRSSQVLPVGLSVLLLPHPDRIADLVTLPCVFHMPFQPNQEIAISV